VGTKEEMTRMRNSFPELKAHLPTRRAKTIEAARFRQEFCKTKGISLKHHCLLSCDVCGDYGFSSNARSKGKNQSWQKWCEVCEESYVSGKKRHDKCCMKCGFTFRDANNDDAFWCVCVWLFKTLSHTAGGWCWKSTFIIIIHFQIREGKFIELCVSGEKVSINKL
jgi:hypothetical protein